MSSLEENNQIKSVSKHETADLNGQKQILLFLNFEKEFNGDLDNLVDGFEEKSLRKSFLRLSHTGDILSAADSSRYEKTWGRLLGYKQRRVKKNSIRKNRARSGSTFSARSGLVSPGQARFTLKVCGPGRAARMQTPGFKEHERNHYLLTSGYGFKEYSRNRAFPKKP